MQQIDEESDKEEFSNVQLLDDDWEKTKIKSLETSGGGSKFVKKKVYNRFDLLDHFESMRYSSEF
jgi:hypothetical protein